MLAALSTQAAPPPALPAHVYAALPSSDGVLALLAIPPHGSAAGQQHTLVVPVGNMQDLAVVEPLTALTVLVSFVWLARVAWTVARRLGSADREARAKTA